MVTSVRYESTSCKPISQTKSPLSIGGAEVHYFTGLLISTSENSAKFGKFEHLKLENFFFYAAEYLCLIWTYALQMTKIYASDF